MGTSSAGNLSPADFIPLAEDAGLIVALGQWVLREGMPAGATVADRTAAVAPPVGGRERFRAAIRARRVARRSRSALAETGLHPRHLKLEITETAIMQSGDPALAELNAIRDTGVEFHLDDFGTGYSSLAYLSRMPIEALKIDRSFIAALGNGRASTSIVEAILALARDGHAGGRRGCGTPIAG